MTAGELRKELEGVPDDTEVELIVQDYVMDVRNAGYAENKDSRKFIIYA